MLTRYGSRVEPYADPTKALQAFRADPDAYDVIVTDLRMPGLMGTDLIDAARLVRPGVPAILISSYFDDMENPTAVENLIMVQKPLEMQQFARFSRASVGWDSSNFSTYFHRL